MKIAKGTPSINQNPNPWNIKVVQNIGKRNMWVYPKTWKWLILTHFVEVIAIIKIIVIKINPVTPGIVVNKSSK